MAIWHTVTTWVLPILFVLFAAMTVVTVSTGCAAKALDGVPGWWFWPLLLLFAGDAFSANRPMWERACKGIAVALFAAALAIGWLRARHARPDPAT
jgi:hypothetical protein